MDPITSAQVFLVMYVVSATLVKFNNFWLGFTAFLVNIAAFTQLAYYTNLTPLYGITVYYAIIFIGTLAFATIQAIKDANK